MTWLVQGTSTYCQVATTNQNEKGKKEFSLDKGNLNRPANFTNTAMIYYFFTLYFFTKCFSQERLGSGQQGFLWLSEGVILPT